MCGRRGRCCLLGLLWALFLSPRGVPGLPGPSARLPLPGPLPHVEKYEVVYPLRVPGPRARRDLSPTPYPESLRYVLAMAGRNVTLRLRRNRDLMGASYTETYTLANGTEVTERAARQDHCFYQGHVEGHEDSAASISACRGIRGFFRTGATAHLIEPLEEGGAHAVYRAEQLVRELVTCGVSNSTLEDLEPRMSAAQKPRNWKSASKETRYVELYVVVDHAEYRKYRNRENIRSRVKEIVNHVDKLYQKLGFRVVLIGLEIWDRQDKAQVSSSPEATLENFLRWRSRELVPRKKHDNAQLITGVDFEHTTVGLAKVASMCTLSSGAVNQDHHENPIGVASTIAHEMGHNLGMDHDENVPGCYCQEHRQNGGCIMAASLSTVFPKTFSSCSRNNLENFVGSNIFQASCLSNPPRLEDIYGGPACGNGFVEPGEECDCGSPEDCTNRCCNATTCRLTPGATCAQGECCHECQVLPEGRECRKARDSCDLPEFCDGRRGECPENVFQENGAPCPGGYCYNGACPTYRQQCRALWGDAASVASDRCFVLNGLTGCSVPLPSQRNFNKCGVLQCSGGMVSQRAYCTITLDRSTCAMVGRGDAEEPFERVVTGTKCGERMVCYNGRCQDLRVYGAENCSSQCSGHGVCNHKRECHCQPGWAPPYCQQRVTDATSDHRPQPESPTVSLPVSERSCLTPTPAETTGAQGVLVGILVPLAVLTLLLLVAFVLYKRRGLPPFQKRKIATEAPSGLSNPLFREAGSKKPGPASAAPAAPHPKPGPGVPRQPPPAPPAALRPEAPFQVPVYTRQVPPQNKPAPPSKPLPELKPKQVLKPTSAPPPPPLKPPAGPAQGAGPKVALKPPVQRR
ncbi:disintegrin and metalloproteinase domain-containing protein 8 isoform X1 [Antechinus flavipes]|uniref:disintegrin and metalloproteinase domain-containing protein 8 isoform X1 n=1 Tax=Antechinus flavipes TaxID=38775 RepID=UPI002235E057|nr:disintegrin and metalloproteinase domain-containing protein 8 isoform X1 [Antechinus flavipes]